MAGLRRFSWPHHAGHLLLISRRSVPLWLCGREPRRGQFSGVPVRLESFSCTPAVLRFPPERCDSPWTRANEIWGTDFLGVLIPPPRRSAYGETSIVQTSRYSLRKDCVFRPAPLL